MKENRPRPESGVCYLLRGASTAETIAAVTVTEMILPKVLVVIESDNSEHEEA